jgi:hypothetical protein
MGAIVLFCIVSRRRIQNGTVQRQVDWQTQGRKTRTQLCEKGREEPTLV